MVVVEIVVVTTFNGQDRETNPVSVNLHSDIELNDLIGIFGMLVHLNTTTSS